jgi:nickel-dependent lactate racemase
MPPDSGPRGAVADGCLTSGELVRAIGEGLRELPLDAKRVLVIVPDGTRTMPMALAFECLDRELGPRVSALDVLVALGTHAPMSDAALSRHLGRPVVDGYAGSRRVFNHHWEEASTFALLGTIPAREIEALTEGRLSQDIPVALNRLVLDYDHVLICGPVFPHEVVGMSGGTKYLFPGIAAPEIIHATHWLGALITSSAVIGTIDTPVRAVINRAAALLDTPISLLAFVVTHEGTAGVFCGDVEEAWRRAAELSQRRHICWLEAPVRQMLAVMPPMYEDIWTAGKGVYKGEPAVADGGEIIVLAPHVREVSRVHGALLEQIGYHCRDYFLQQWERFRTYPGGILAHSTHVRGVGTYDAVDGRERSRIDVTLATSIPEDMCRRVNLGYRDPAHIDARDWPTAAGGDRLMVARAGEVLYRVGQPPAGHGFR